MRVAQELVNEKKNDSAIIVLDKSQEFFPHSKIPYDYFMLPWIDLYFEAGARDKAVQMMETLSKRYIDDLSYYIRLGDKFVGFYDNSIQEALAVINRIGETAKKHGETDLEKRINDAVDTNLKLLGL